MESNHNKISSMILNTASCDSIPCGEPRTQSSSQSVSGYNTPINSFHSTESKKLSESRPVNMADPNTNTSSYNDRFSFEDEADPSNTSTTVTSTANPCTSLIQHSLRASAAPPQVFLSESVDGNSVGSTETIVRRPEAANVESQSNEQERETEQSTGDAVTKQQFSMSSEDFDEFMPYFLEVDDETRQAMVDDARSKKKPVRDSPPIAPRTSDELLRSSLDSFLKHVGINSDDQREILEGAHAGKQSGAMFDLPPPPPLPPHRLTDSTTIDRSTNKIGANFARLKKKVRFQYPESIDTPAPAEEGQTQGYSVLSESPTPAPLHTSDYPNTGDKIKTNIDNSRGYPLRLLLTPKSSLDRCVYDNLFHDHDHYIDAENSVQRSVAFIHEGGPCTCFASKYGFQITSCDLTHGEGRLHVRISNPYCMICSERISYVLDRTLTHVKPHTIFLRSSSIELRENARTMSLTAEQMCGQTFHSKCLANMIKNDIREGRQSLCPSCKRELPVQQMSTIQRIGNSVGRIFSSLTGFLK